MTDRLQYVDKVRLTEALHLKQQLGDSVWSGWGDADAPVLLWNRDYAFMVGHPALPSGWHAVERDSLAGQTYYRQRTQDAQTSAVLVGNARVASMGTKWEMDALAMEHVRDLLPWPLEPLFPYRLAIQPSEAQISYLLHETFHVHQAHIAPERLAAASATRARGDQYGAADRTMHSDWWQEANLLVVALGARSRRDAVEQTRRFLEHRRDRRAGHDLGAELIAYERQLEWQEGLAKYVELRIWREAQESPDYEPVLGMRDDPDFRDYTTFQQRWLRELAEMRLQALISSEARFYYTGMAQAVLLDRLLPGWKERVLSEDVWLETLLAEAARP